MPRADIFNASPSVTPYHFWKEAPGPGAASSHLLNTDHVLLSFFSRTPSQSLMDPLSLTAETLG